jgi:uncharacterized membrane protein (UPF0136 family)
MDTLLAAWKALLREPLAIVMALVAVGCILAAFGYRVRAHRRVWLVVLAVITGITSWMMASNWQWPR